ncbi:hypothetical protein DFH94DRAFT_637710, partial [Russula ochroleuca]
WSVGSHLNADHVWDSIIILLLIEDCHDRQQTLVVPHDGTQKNHFKEAIHACNLRFRLYSWPEIQHYCKKCVQFYCGPDGTVHHMVSVVPLAYNCHCFCPDDTIKYDTICAIVGCDDPIITGHLTCANPHH